MSQDVIPSGDSELDTFQKIYIDTIAAAPAPYDLTGCALASLDTATPYLYEFEAADAGKTAFWLLRWVSTRGENGPLGVVVSGKINP